MSRTKDPNVSDHAAALRRAMVLADVRQDDVATALGVNKRTVVNWTSRTNPTMPSETDREKLNRLLPGYAHQGDPVEAAIALAELAPFRQAELVAVYKRLLHEQALEDKALG